MIFVHLFGVAIPYTVFPNPWIGLGKFEAGNHGLVPSTNPMIKSRFGISIKIIYIKPNYFNVIMRPY